MMKWLFIVVFAIFSKVNLYSKDSFEGIIEYSVSIEGDNAEMMSSFLFSGYLYHFGENGVRVEMLGGMSYMFGPFITNYLTNKTYMLSPEEEIAYELEDDEENTTSDDDKKINSATSTDKKPLVEDLHETEMIMGYKTNKYKVTTYEEEGPVEMYYWMTTAISIGEVKDNIGVSIAMEGLSGYPLKIQTEFDGYTMTQIVTSIKKQKVDDGFFTVPSGYDIKPFSESPIGSFGSVED